MGRQDGVYGRRVRVQQDVPDVDAAADQVDAAEPGAVDERCVDDEADRAERDLLEEEAAVARTGGLGLLEGRPLDGEERDHDVRALVGLASPAVQWPQDAARDGRRLLHPQLDRDGLGGRREPVEDDPEGALGGCQRERDERDVVEGERAVDRVAVDEVALVDGRGRHGQRDASICHRGRARRVQHDTLNAGHTRKLQGREVLEGVGGERDVGLAHAVGAQRLLLAGGDLVAAELDLLEDHRVALLGGRELHRAGWRRDPRQRDLRHDLVAAVVEDGDLQVDQRLQWDGDVHRRLPVDEGPGGAALAARERVPR